jgi:hypothetical protein
VNYTDRATKLVPTFVDRGCHMISMPDPCGRILGFLDRSRYFFFQVAPQLYSQGWVDPIPDPLLLRKSGTAGNRTRSSGSVARNSDHQTTEAVYPESQKLKTLWLKLLPTDWSTNWWKFLLFVNQWTSEIIFLVMKRLKKKMKNFVLDYP